jgi:phosphoribosylanthranilate isomerase
VEDALAVARAGADALGLVFYPDSPRCVEITQAQAICRALPPFVSTVALFVNAPRKQVETVLEAVPVDMLQFHGDESVADCENYARPYIKAIGMQPGLALETVMAAHSRASGFLLDAWQPDTHGGGGVAFDWTRVPVNAGQPLILAGGLHAGNVAEAIQRTRPYAVDVSSGVESRKGIKSEEEIEKFMRGVERGDAS